MYTVHVLSIELSWIGIPFWFQARKVTKRPHKMTSNNKGVGTR